MVHRHPFGRGHHMIPLICTFEGRYTAGDARARFDFMNEYGCKKRRQQQQQEKREPNSRLWPNYGLVADEIRGRLVTHPVEALYQRMDCRALLWPSTVWSFRFGFHRVMVEACFALYHLFFILSFLFSRLFYKRLLGFDQNTFRGFGIFVVCE